MNNKKNKEQPGAPSLIKAMVGGFDSVANHIYLITFPIAFDLLLWLGPRLRLNSIIHAMLDQFNALQKQDAFTSNAPDIEEMVRVTREVWVLIAERANLFSAMRTYPVGVPSIMVGRLPIESPLSTPIGIDMSFGIFPLTWISLMVFGLLFGTFYFSLTARAALHAEQAFWDELKDLPRAFTQVIWLTLFLAVLLIAISIPLVIVSTLVIMFAGSIGQWVILALSGLLLWLFFPLLFSPHGIFVNRLKMFHSFLRGVRLAQMNLPKTSMFFLLAFVISQGLDVLWQTPPEDSWLSLIGILGHAFVSTALLASSFVYYQQAEKWFQNLVLQQQAALHSQQATTNSNHKT